MPNANVQGGLISSSSSSLLLSSLELSDTKVYEPDFLCAAWFDAANRGAATRLDKYLR